MPLKFRWETEFKGTEIGAIPRGWDVKKIGEIGTVITGKTPPTKIKVFWGDKYPFVTPTDITDFDIRYSYKVERYLSEEWLYKARSLLLAKNSVCFVCIGSTIGKMCLLKEPSFTNQQINSIIVNEKNDSKFVYYLLRCNQEKIKEEFGGGGAAKDIISKSKFENIELLIPKSKEEQSRIAIVLSCFDYLIENKKRQNDLLENTAMAIFKNWFIDFRPFKKEKFKDSELGEIPEGWEIKAIGDVATPFKGISYNSPDISPEPQGSLFITLNNFLRSGGFKAKYCYYIGNRANESHKVKDGKLIIALTDMTPQARVVGAPAIVVLPNACDLGVISLDCAKLQPVNDYLKYYLYLYLKFSQEENSTFANGVNVLHLNTKLFMQNKLVIIPLRPLLENFHSLVEPLFQKIITNRKQIMVLRKVRDTLLPLLIFGKLRVESV